MNENEMTTTMEPQEEGYANVYVDSNPAPSVPMKWFGFYKVLLVIWAAGYGVYAVLSLILGIVSTFSSEGVIGGVLAVFIAMAVLGAGLCVLCVYLFRGLRRFRLKAYKVNMWFTIVLGIFSAAGVGITVMAGIVAGLGMAGTVAFGAAYALLGLIYPFCSITYFEKRKYLFHDEVCVDEVCEDEADENKKSGVRLRYTIAHFVVAALMIVLAVVLTPAEWSEYLSQAYDDYDDYYEYYETLERADGIFTEEETDEAVISANFDEIAEYLGYIDADELMTEIEFIEAEDYDNEIDLHGMDQKEAYQFIFTEYFGLSDYENALYGVNPYNEEVITSFGDYQEYVMMGVEEFYSL